MQFPNNIPAVTVWEKTTDTASRTSTYTRHVTGAAYWQGNLGQTPGRSEDDSILCAIHAGNVGSYTPKKDDRILPGTVTGDTPPDNAFVVEHVKDFRYGSGMMQHIELYLA